MKNAAFAGLKVMRAPFGLSVMSLLALLCFNTSLPAAEDAGTAASPAGATTTAYLEYTVARVPLINWGLTLSPEPKPFQKEPDTGGRKVSRANLRLGADSEEATGFLWDYTKGKLYLDLNHNRDLTDDPTGVVTSSVRSYSYYYQTFTNVTFSVRTPRGSYPACVDLNLYGPEAGHPSGNAASRSFWAGKVLLQGKEYQVGRADGMAGQFGMDNQGYLLLRRWEQREQSWDLINGGLDAFGYAPNLFFDGQAYRVDCAFLQQEGTSKFKISFREKDVPLGELKLTGKFIERLVLAGARQNSGRAINRKPAQEMPTVFTTVLDHPEPLVKVPVGEYQQWQVSLRSGAVSAHSQPTYGGPPATVEVTANGAKQPVLAAGGPLTNSVSAQGQGSRLALSYQLLGGGGVTYQLAGQDRKRPPRFVVYKNGKSIHSGQFEFG